MKRLDRPFEKPSARVAVIANDAIGNFAVSTPLLQMLRRELRPARIEFFCGKRAQEFAVDDRLFDEFVPLHGSEPRAMLASLAEREPQDLVVVMERSPFAMTVAAQMAGGEGWVCGPCVGHEGRGELPYADDARGDLWRDREWISEEIRARYPFLESGFIGEIFCRLAYLEGPVPTYAIPSKSPGRSLPPALIACSASLPNKLWTEEGWLRAADWLRGQGLEVGLIGAPPRDQGRYWLGSSLEDRLVAAGVHDLRGTLSLPEVAGALAEARVVLTLDNGILHLAAAANVPTVGLFRHGIHRLWCPPFGRITALTPGEGREVAEIRPESVVGALEAAIR